MQLAALCGKEEMAMADGVDWASAFEERWCRRCGAVLTKENCRWKRFPGICEDCAPPGVLMHLPRRGHLRWRVLPRCWPSFKLQRKCGCGRWMGYRLRMCDVCSREKRAATYRKANQRRLRRERRRKNRQRRTRPTARAAKG